MASFRIHEDQENTSSLGMRKENTEVFSALSQRRALGDLNQFACNQTRNAKVSGLSNGTFAKSSDENKTLRNINNEKNIVPPVAQFRAFSVYEDRPSENETKKREPTYKPFVAKDIKNDNIAPNVDNSRSIILVEKQPDLKKEVPLRLPLQDKLRDVPPESPMSVGGDSILLSMSISKTPSQVTDEEEEDTTTARTDREMFFHVAEYRQDIYEYMREIEVKHQPNPRYMRKQPDISHSMRMILVDWLAEVCEEYSQQSETLHLAVSYVDRFLSFMRVVRGKLQLVGTAATFIAAKYEEVYPPEVGEFVYITDDTYNKREVLRMEHLILKVLSFDLSTPTALAFLSHYCISHRFSKRTFHLASYIAELSLLEADPYLQFKRSVIAASALATARHCLYCKHCEEESTDTWLDSSPYPECLETAWPAALVQASGYELAELEPCMRELARTHAHAPHQPQQAIPDKYKSNKFDGVSKIEPRPLYVVPPLSAPTPAARIDTRPASDTTRTS